MTTVTTWKAPYDFVVAQRHTLNHTYNIRFNEQVIMTVTCSFSDLNNYVRMLNIAYIRGFEDGQIHVYVNKEVGKQLGDYKVDFLPPTVVEV